jgi:dTDP-4-amino-4,6-dideoxy-D-galactose acyltransferase
MTDEPCRHLEWDSRFFGVEIAQVATGTLDAAAIGAVDRWCADRQIDCLYFLADAPGPSTACAEDAGFHLVDVRVELTRALAPAPSDLPPRTPAAPADATPHGLASPVASARRVRPAEPRDVPALRAIARTSHRDSRFYRDERFPRARCDALYETWIEKSCQGAAAAVLVADTGGIAAGYVTCEQPAETVGRIGLFAVAAEARGRGAGTALVASALAWLAARGVETVGVATQGRNVAAQQLYQTAGFRTAALRPWYHRWRAPRSDA